MTTYGFIRHGITDWNAEGRAQGLTDVPLNEEGIRQAKQLAIRLQHEKWDSIYSSDLARARVTAETIAETLGLQVTYDVRLREKSHGRLDGTTVAERVKLWGEEWRDLDHGEETTESIIERSMAFIREISSKHPKDKVLLVSHGAWIARTLEHILEVDDLPNIGNTSICVLEENIKLEGQEDIDNQETILPGWNCLLMACSKHLNEAEK